MRRNEADAQMAELVDEQSGPEETVSAIAKTSTKVNLRLYNTDQDFVDQFNPSTPKTHNGFRGYVWSAAVDTCKSSMFGSMLRMGEILLYASKFHSEGPRANPGWSPTSLVQNVRLPTTGSPSKPKMNLKPGIEPKSANR